MTMAPRGVDAALTVAAAGTIAAAEDLGDLVNLPALGGIGSAALIALLVGAAVRLIMSDRADRRVDKRWQDLANEEKARRVEVEDDLDRERRDNMRLRATLYTMGIDPGPATHDRTDPSTRPPR